ncbi:MAG: class I SAM-dependent methyltransferase [Vicinamibacterales bacterium]
MDANPFAAVRTRYGIPAAGQVAELGLLNALNDDVECRQALIETINTDLGFERVMTTARQLLLDTYCSDRAALARLRPLVAALAHQGFNNEYVCATTDREERALRELKVSALWSAPVAEVAELEWAILIWTMYRPLSELTRGPALSAALAGVLAADVDALVTRSLREPAEEHRLASEMASFGRIDDAASLAVQAQYDQHPYPRWLHLTATGRTIRQQAQRLKPWGDSHLTAPEPLQALVAGCGTGYHPLRLAIDNPNAEIVAFDFSRTALGYAARMARDLAIRNVTFLHGDLLSVGELRRQFHHVECGGVLHHISDHRRAWSELAAVLHPGGTMQIGVYNKAARLVIDHFRARRPEAVGPLPAAEVRRLRRILVDEPGYTALVAHLSRTNDFYSTSMVTDLLFHVFERHYTVADIQSIVTALGLDLIGVNVPRAIRLRVEAREPGALWPVTTFNRWRQVEWAFAGTAMMFRFWLTKPAGPHEGHAV